MFILHHLYLNFYYFFALLSKCYAVLTYLFFVWWNIFANTKIRLQLLDPQENIFEVPNFCLLLDNNYISRGYFKENGNDFSEYLIAL